MDQSTTDRRRAAAPGPGYARAASRGALVGAAAALIVALGDFGASWLWLVSWRDRWELLLRLVGIEV
ncbi:MAG: hypothetical protein ACOCUS_07210, partial [Polyangiales bacterium]